jgi:hypothetical protein
MTHFYEDPTAPEYQRPNLIERLMRYPSRQALTPHENQITETLAWLLSESPTLAREFARLAFEDDPEALASLDEANSFGARTQLALALPEGGTVFPDLSLAGNDGSFELLVEVKIDAAPHAFGTEENFLLQPDMYVRAWEQRPEETQARVRRVVTLTRSFDFPKSESALRGPDLVWTQVADVLEFQLAADAVEPTVALVARDFLEVVRAHILGVVDLPPSEHVEALLAHGRELVILIGEYLREYAGASGATKAVRRRDYQGTFLWMTTPDEVPVQFWLTVTPAGSRYNIRGFGDCVSFRIMEAADVLGDARLLAGGFRYRQDIAGYRCYHVSWALDTNGGHISDVGAVADRVAGDFVRVLGTCSPPLR